MKIIPLSSVEVRKRQRKVIAPRPLNELIESILRVGLLHPPVMWLDGEKWVLSVGERRLSAFKKLNEDRTVHDIRCGEDIIPPHHIAITPLGDYLDEMGRFEAELDENIQREELPWPDRVQALADLHEMRKKANPDQTLRDTGEEVVNKGGQKSVGGAAKAVRDAVIIAPFLGNEKIAKARNAEEAIGLIYAAQEAAATSALIKRRLITMAAKPTLEVRHGDLLVELPRLDPGTFDLVLADPPYGIDASGAGFRARTIHHHNYLDDSETAQALYRSILVEGFRVTKPRANIFLFCDVDYFDWLKRAAANMGWVPFRRPLIWQKSESEGMAPWGGQGPRITTEYIFYATKGQRGLNASPTDIFNVRRVSRSERIHAAEKPVELLQKLIECATLPGDSVLDPCCGSGSTLVACRESKRVGLGIEKDLEYFNAALSNLHSEDVPNGEPPSENDVAILGGLIS